MNKWLVINERIFNLKRMDRIYFNDNNGYWQLWIFFNSKPTNLYSGEKIEVERRLKAIKDFLKSSEMYLEME